MVWKDTTRFGCGITDRVVVCNYCYGDNFVNPKSNKNLKFRWFFNGQL